MKYLQSFVIRILSRYFGLVRVPPSFGFITQEPSQFTVVTQSGSIIIAGLLHSFARRSGLRGVAHCRTLFPEEGAPLPRTPSTLYWLSMKDEALLEKIIDTDPNQKFSTLNIFERQGPAKNYPSYTMSIFRLTRVLLGCRFYLVVFGNPCTLNSEVSHQGKHLARSLKVDYYRNLKLVRGTPFQPISAQERSVLSGPEYEREIGILSERLGITKQEVHERARKGFYEMAANPKSSMYSFAILVCRFFIRRLFSDVITTGIESFTNAQKDNTVVLVPMHRSHLDYVLLGYTLFEHKLNTPVVAAGVNLSTWPFGFFIRSLGGFFVKRNARGDRIHALLLKRYVTYLVKSGHLQEFFIEGGRSRSGKMARPKLGLLGIMVGAYLKSIRKDLLFVPVSITYENVIEDRSFGEENTGRSKKKENLLNLLRAHKLFRKKYGEVIINFGEPISISAFSRDPRVRNGKGEVDEKTLTQKLARTLIDRIRKQKNVSLTSLAYSSICMTPAYGISRTGLAASIKNLCHLVELMRVRLEPIGDFTPSLKLFLSGREAILDDIARGGIVEMRRYLGQDIFVIPGEKRFTADFYKNSSIHLFLPISLLSVVELTRGEIRLSEVMKYHDLLEFDFQLPEKAEFEHIVDTWIRILLEAAALTNRDGKLTFQAREPGQFIPALLLSTFESFLWVYRSLSHTEGTLGDSSEPKRTYDYEETVSRLQNNFRTGVYLGTLSRTEGASKAAITAALETLQNKQVIAIEESGGKKQKITVMKSFSTELSLVEESQAAIRRFFAEQLFIQKPTALSFDSPTKVSEFPRIQNS